VDVRADRRDDHVDHTTFDTLEKRATSVNVHTVKNPAGEIRAQLKITES
jgi:CHRD domain-containing protein